MDVGILALQGCIQPHIDACSRLGALARPVRFAEELAQAKRLIIPGGESTTMLSLLERRGLLEELARFARSKPVWGVCAGAILLARQVLNPQQKSLALMDIRATRNYYGCQLDSFKARVEVGILDLTTEVDFIRAPLLEPLSTQVGVLASHDSHAVLLKQGRLLASSFHIELSHETALHKYFLLM